MTSVSVNATLHPSTRGVPARIGPNSVLQTLRALEELESVDARRAIAAGSDLPDPLPPGLIPEALFVRLVRQVRQALPQDRADAVLRRSGAYTAAYVARHRIPAPFRALLGVLPARLGVPLLLAAFRRHAWTFAGAGAFSVDRGELVLEGSPTCRDSARAPGRGAYYEAAFEGLLSLAAPGVKVREVACQSLGADSCRFVISR